MKEGDTYAVAYEDTFRGKAGFADMDFVRTGETLVAENSSAATDTVRY